MLKEKKLKTYRLSLTARNLLEKLSEKTSLSHTALIETSIRIMAKQENISLE